MPYQAELATVGTQEGLKATAAEAADPERFFTNNLCWNHYHGCAGDIRHYLPLGHGWLRPRQAGALQRFRAGRRADLVCRAGTRQGRIRRPHLRPQG